MILLDTVDAIPEAMIVAGATADGRMTVAFALSVFLLNTVNTMATAVDYLAVRPERGVHRLLVVLVFFSVGSLFLSVSEAVFENFLETIQLHRGDADYLLLLPIFGGIVCGVGVVWGVIYAQTEWSKRGARLGIDSTDGAIADSVVMVKQSIGREQESIYLLQGSATTSANQQQVLEYHQGRLEKLAKLEKLKDALQTMNDVSVSAELPITDDTRAIIDDAIIDEISLMHSSGRHLLLENAASVEVEETLNKRAIRLLLVYLFVGTWTVLLVFLLTPLFAYLHTGYADAFADGFSAGSFFSVISSTMIPRIQQDAYRSHWSSLTFRVVGMLAFVSGICATFLLELIPPPGQ